MKSLLFIVGVAMSIAQTATAQPQVEVTVLAGLLRLDSTGSIGGTPRTLRFGESPSAAVRLNYYWSDYFSTEVGGTFSRPKVAIRSGESQVNGARLLFGQPDLILQYHFSPGARIQPYAGAGAMYLTFRRAQEDIAIDGITVRRIEQPDHMALLLDAGVNVVATRAISLVIDGRYGPAQSTAEVYESDNPGHTKQSNFHPLIVAAGLSYRF